MKSLNSTNKCEHIACKISLSVRVGSSVWPIGTVSISILHIYLFFFNIDIFYKSKLLLNIDYSCKTNMEK